VAAQLAASQEGLSSMELVILRVESLDTGAVNDPLH
jgi:hypothetical protein